MKGYTLKDCLRRQNGMSRYALNLEHRLRWYDTELAKAQKRIWELKDLLDYEKSISDQKQNEINLKYREVIALQEHVEELEKENADLKMGLKWDADNRDELLKENAKLKETVACLREDIDVKRKDIDWYKKRGAELDSMLTDKIREIKKAKQIIKELLDLRCSVSSAKDVENRFAVREKANRFLEEEE